MKQTRKTKGKAKGKSKAAGRRIPVPLDEDEQRALLAVPNVRYPTGLRNKAMMRLMLDNGLRVSEVVNLRWVDLTTTGESKTRLHVHEGKGGKDRIVWVSDAAFDLLILWRERQREFTKRKGRIFTTLTKKHTKENKLAGKFTTRPGDPLSVRYIQMVVKRYAGKVGIEKRVSPHVLRHTYATDFLRRTKDIMTLKDNLGHAFVSTTQIYTHLSDDERKHSRNFREDKPAGASMNLATVEAIQTLINGNGDTK